MPQSTGRDLHIDRLLSNVAISYSENATIAGTIAPVVPVGKQSDAYAVFNRGDAFRIEETKRAPDTEANKVTRSISSDTYFANNYALKAAVTIEDRANADPIHRQKLINGRAEYVTRKLMLDWEYRVAQLAFTLTNVGSGAGVASEWDASASSDPIGDLQTAMDNVEDLTGTRPNRILLGNAAWRSLRRNDQILDRIFGADNGGGFANRAQVAGLLEVDALLVGNAYRNTAAEGQAESLSPIWGDHALCYYAPNAPSMDDPSFMYSFRWAEAGLPQMQVERHPFDTRRKSEEVEVGYYQDEKITGSEYGYLVVAVNSST